MNNATELNTGENALFDTRRDQDNTALFMAVGLALLAHVGLMSIVAIDPDTDRRPAVSIEILLTGLQQSTQRFPAERLNQQPTQNAPTGYKERATNKDSENTTKPESTNERLASEPESLIESSQRHNTQSLLPELSRQKLEDQVREVVETMTGRSAGSPERSDDTAPVTFSVADFPSRDQPRIQSSWTDQLDLDPKRLVAGKINGMLAYRIKDMFGNIRCLAQRGNPADPSSWLWHRVPAASCEGLK